MLLIWLTFSVHLLQRYLGSFSHNWRRTLVVFKSFMYCIPIMAFLACSRAIKNSCYPVPSLGLTAGQLDSLAMYALAILYGSPKCFFKSRLASLYGYPLFICRQPFISSFAFLLVYWSKKYKRSLELSTLDSMINAGCDITSPENVGGSWLGKRLLACCVTIICDSFACFLWMLR